MLTPFVLGASLSCSITTAGACSDTIVMYLENETGGNTNAHSQNVSVATYANVVCCVPTGDTLSLSCSDQIFGVISDTDDAHFEQNDQGNYAVNQCLSATTNHVVCAYSATGCGAYDTCLFAYASSDGANVTNSHVGSCSDYNYNVCCTLNDKPILASLTLNATSAQNLSRDNLTAWIGSVTDSESDTYTNITDWRVDDVSLAVLNVPLNINKTYSSDVSISDYSTYGNDGVLGDSLSTQVPVWSSSCVVGGCYDFDGVDDEISFVDSASLDVLTEFTLSAWVYLDSCGTGSSKSIVTKRQSYYITSNASCHYRVYLSGTTSPGWHSSTEAMTTGEWHHTLSTYSSSAGELKLYIDGQLNATFSTSGTISASLNKLNVGGVDTESGRFLDGKIDEVQLFDRALSAQQITALYDAGLAGNPFTTIVSNETASGENWTVVVTPNDGYQDGDSVTSNGVYITAGEVLIAEEIVFTNSSTSHSFLVDAGASYSSGASGITATSINTSSGTCDNVGTSLNGIYYNVTFNCTGTPYVSSSINITFCDAASNCNTTATASNDYPNQAPTMNSLLLPVDGNETLIDRNVVFTWQAGSDAESDPLNYSLNVTNTICQDRTTTQINDTTYTFGPEFNTSFECSNNNYYWQVQACDEWDCSTSWSSQFNFSIQDYLDITILTSEVNFSSVEILSGGNTTDDSPPPFLFENSGNIAADLVAVESTGLWSAVSLNTTYYQYKVDNSTETGSFNWGASYTDWLNVTSLGNAATLVSYLDYNDTQDTVQMEMLIEVPSGEPSGDKTDTLTFVWQTS